MYVCLCNAVTEKHIAEAIAGGISRMKDLRSALKVTTTCGRCTTCARECFQNCIDDNSSCEDKCTIAEAS